MAEYTVIFEGNHFRGCGKKRPHRWTYALVTRADPVGALWVCPKCFKLVKGPSGGEPPPVKDE